MATRLQRAQETLKREEKKSDLKRLKEARSHLQAAYAFLKDPIHDTETETYVDTIRLPIADFAVQLQHVIVGDK